MWNRLLAGLASLVVLTATLVSASAAAPAAAAPTLTEPAAASAYDPNVPYKIVNKKSGRALSAYQGGIANGTRAILYDFINAEDQLWYIADAGDGFLKIINKKSGRALSTLDGGSTNGTPIHLWDYLGTYHDQHWSISAGSSGYVKITNRKGGRAVSCLDGGTANNTAIHLWDYLGGYDDQDWSIVAVPQTKYDPAASYKIINKKSGRALSAYRAGMDNGTRAILWDFVNAEDQLWHIVDIGFGFYKIINNHSGRALSTLDGGSTNGTPIHLWDYLGSYPDQHWAISAGSPGYVKITNKNSARAVSCRDGGTANDTAIHLWDYLGGYDDQDWSIVPVTQTATVDANTVVANVSRHMTGVGMEDVNHEIYGGLYSQMVFGESFQEPQNQAGVSGMWRGLTRGVATGVYALDTTAPFKGSQSQRVTHTGGTGQIGIENRGLNRWGMNIQGGKAYEGYVYLRASAATRVTMAFESADGGVVYAESSVTTNSTNWTRYDFTLTPGSSNRRGRFSIKLNQPGSVNVGHAFLQPGTWGRFNGLPVRKDIADGLVAQGNTVLRFGGSAVNSPHYRWKNMVGPRDLRPATPGTWYPYESNGWGIFDFLNFAESAGMLGIPTINIDESPQDVSDFMDYAIGSTSTVWGQKRAADGHPAPYNLKYLELGNEEAVNDTYYEKFERLAKVVWAKDPNVVVVVGDFQYSDVIVDPYNFTGAPLITSLAGHKKILDLAKAHNREVWFDIHVWTDNPLRVPNWIAALESLHRHLTKLSPGAAFKIGVFELNANAHDMNRALANALAMGMMQRLGDKVRVVTSANALQPDGQNDNGWDQGLLFFNPDKTWGQPPYYVTKMKSANYQPIAVQTAVSGRESVTFDVTATRSSTGGTLLLEVTNTIDVPRTYSITLNGFTPTQTTARVTTLSAPLSARNSATNPTAVRPTEADVQYTRVGNTITFTFAPNSFTVIRLQ